MAVPVATKKFTDQEKVQYIREQEKIKEALASEGMQIILQKLQIVAEKTVETEAKSDPFTAPGEIVKARQLRYVIGTLIPQILEGLVNFDPDAIDGQVAPNERWTFAQWSKALTAGKGKDDHGN